MNSLKRISYILLVACLLTACAKGNSNQHEAPATQQTESDDGYQLQEDVENINEYLDYSNSKLKHVYFAGGCFWGVEAFFKKIYGVQDVVSGYANGTMKNPSYQDVIKGEDGFVEAVEIAFDPERVDLKTLVDDLFLVIDPTSKNKQGNDVGIQYRTGVYSKNRDDLDILQKAVNEKQALYDKEIATEVDPLENFYLAEEVHQDYLAKNPNGYCHIDLNIADSLTIQPLEKDEKIVKKHSVSNDRVK